MNPDTYRKNAVPKNQLVSTASVSDKQGLNFLKEFLKEQKSRKAEVGAGCFITDAVRVELESLRDGIAGRLKASRKRKRSVVKEEGKPALEEPTPKKPKKEKKRKKKKKKKKVKKGKTAK